LSNDNVPINPVGATEGAPAGPSAGELSPGATLGKYRLDRVLGAGGMGVVWGAFDPDLERPVALKILRAADVTVLRTRLLREARAMARLKHPNVVTVYEVGTDRNRDYIAMELVDGASLERWLADAPPRPEILAALLAAGRGLAAAHDAGLVHRDFKPHNVLRSAAGHVFVTDFGLARGTLDDGSVVLDAAPATAAIASGSAPLLSHLTQTGVLVGTPAYMAPEQFAGRTPEPRSDQFAFCVTAWEALAGAHPFRGGFAALRGSQDDARAQLGELQAIVSAGAPAAGLPPKVRAVLARGLAADPEARWPDMYALLKALGEATDDRPRSRWWTRAAIAAAVSGVGAVIAILLAHELGGDSSSRGAQPATCDATSSFGDAWSGERRAAVRHAHTANSGMALGAIELLDQDAQRWKQAYEAACKLPLGEDREERLSCLREVQQEFEQTTQGLLDADEAFDFPELVSLGTDIAPCER
jgi:predicted Ser/Thr protein kinase